MSDDGANTRTIGRRRSDVVKTAVTWGTGAVGIPLAGLILYIAATLGEIRAMIQFCACGQTQSAEATRLSDDLLGQVLREVGK